MVYYKTDEEVEYIRKSCLLVCDALAHVASIIRPGITAKEIDTAAEALIRDHGAVPAFKGYRGFPATLCVSINEQVVHGIPTESIVFNDGDIVSVDCGVQWNGFFGDAAYTFPLGNVGEKVMELCRITKTSLYKGIEQAVVGHRVGDISFAIQNYVEKGFNLGIVRELVGHGVGRNLHEEPEVPNYGKRGKGIKMLDGLVIAIEPMVNLGKKEVMTAKDGWTVAAKDRLPSAHYEHTVVVRRQKADILSSHVPIEAAIAKNSEVREVSLKGAGVLQPA